MKTKITLHRGDITKVTFDAIVNAANTSLLGGSGVDGAIHRAGGPRILEECRKIGGCKTGQAVITTGGNLPASYVIHTVGPVWNGGTKREADLLTDCYANALALAVEKGLKTIAFPNISTGIYGFPKREACKIAVRTVRDFVEYVPGLAEVQFVCFDEENYALYETALFPAKEAARLIQQIETAFAGVPFPRETWAQADLRDDYIDHGPQWEAAYANAWKGPWKDMPETELRPASAISFLKPDGMRYYYPACMCYCLRHFQDNDPGNLFESTLFAAEKRVGLEAYFEERFSLFDDAQRSAVAGFLEFFELAFDHPNAVAALRLYWKEWLK
ncbi:MAG: O-acetyl-ADP-ribose deacetylase [Saprospiraceae bacterium]